MAVSNYGLIVDTSNFKPYTFEEIILPLLLAKKDYELAMDKIEKYEEEFGRLNLPETSAYANMLNLFKDDYAKYADAYASSPSTRSAVEMTKLFRRAKKDIAPIREAIIARNKAVEDFNKMRILDPSLIYDEDSFNVDNYMGGNTPDIKAISGNAIEADAAATMKAFADLDPAMPQIIGNLKQAFIMQKLGGLNNIDAFNEAVRMFKQNNITSSGNEAVDKFVNMLNGLLNKYAKAGYKDSQLNLIADRVVSGAIKGIPATQYGLMLSPGYTTPYLLRLLSLAEDLERRQAENDAISRVYQKAQLNASGWFEDDKGNWYEDPSRASGYSFGDEIKIGDVTYTKGIKYELSGGKMKPKVIWTGTNDKELSTELVISEKNKHIDEEEKEILSRTLTWDLAKIKLNKGGEYYNTFKPVFFTGKAVSFNPSSYFNENESSAKKVLDPDEAKKFIDDMGEDAARRLYKKILESNGITTEDMPKEIDKIKARLKENFDYYEDADVWPKRNDYKVVPKNPTIGMDGLNKSQLIEVILADQGNTFTEEELKGKTLEQLLEIKKALGSGF